MMKNKSIKLKNKNGITLIALVITVIVLIILAGISLTMTSGQDGILTRAGEASKKADIASTEEKIQVELTSKYNNDGEYTNEDVIEAIKNATGHEVTEGTKTVLTEKGNEINIYDLWKGRIGINVGDYIDYIPDNVEAYSKDKIAENITGSSNNTSDIVQNTLNWQVLRINSDDSIDLIGTPTQQAVYFSGAEGFNNCVYVLNDICENLYSKKSKGVNARSVNERDFNKWLTDDEKNEDGTIKSKGGKTLKAEYQSGDGNIVYGESHTYTGEYAYEPDIYEKSNNESDKYYSQPTEKTFTRKYGNDGITYTLNVKQTLYGLGITESNYGDGAKVLANSKYYWVATRFVDCNTWFANFGLRNASSNIAGDDMYYSKNQAENYHNRLRPVVILRADIKITPCEGENSIDNMHTIKW